MRKAVHCRRIKVSVCGSTLYIFRPGLILTCPVLLILCSNCPTVLCCVHSWTLCSSFFVQVFLLLSNQVGWYIADDDDDDDDDVFSSFQSPQPLPLPSSAAATTTRRASIANYFIMDPFSSSSSAFVFSTLLSVTVSFRWCCCSPWSTWPFSAWTPVCVTAVSLCVCVPVCDPASCRTLLGRRGEQVRRCSGYFFSFCLPFCFRVFAAKCKNLQNAAEKKEKCRMHPSVRTLRRCEYCFRIFARRNSAQLSASVQNKSNKSSFKISLQRFLFGLSSVNFQPPWTPFPLK